MHQGWGAAAAVEAAAGAQHKADAVGRSMLLLERPPPPHRPTSLHTCPAFQEEASSDWSSAVNMLQRLPVRVGLMMRGEGGWTAVFSVCALLG